MTLVEFSLGNWKRDSEVRMEDAYKWLFHATQGGEHAITSPEGPRLWLEREWKTLGKPLQEEALVVSLRPDGKLVRLNLRPYKALNGKPALLLDAFIKSAKAFRADRAMFKKEWLALRDALKRSPQGYLNLAEWERVDKVMAPEGYPAIEHHALYEKIRQPAYRVLTAEQARRIMVAVNPKR